MQKGEKIKPIVKQDFFFMTILETILIYPLVHQRQTPVKLVTSLKY